MTFTQLLIIVLCIAAIIGIPVAMVWSMIAYFRTPPSKRPGSGALSNAVGAALLEADRLLARPAAEHAIEAQQELPRQDDQSDD